VAGNQLVDNIVLSRDEQVLNWPGVLTNFTTSGSPGSEILLLNQPSATGYYELPWIDAGYAVKASVNVIWSAVGSPVGQDVLLMSDVLSQSDILGGSASASISSHIEIAVLGDATSTDIFAPSDIFSSVDIFGNTAAQWQKFTPGVYPGRYFKFRLVVSNASIATATGNVTALKTTISIPPRIDHYQNQSIAAGGNTIVFQPDGAVATRPFNGGPNGSTVPYVNVTWQNHSGDVLVISGLSLSQLTIQITNGGAGVARTGVNIDVEGY
jgi:hypothetical protein